jgi:hypothetical protein
MFFTILLGHMSCTRINKYSMHKAASEFLYSLVKKKCNKVVTAVNTIIWRIEVSLSTCINTSLGDTKLALIE